MACGTHVVPWRLHAFMCPTPRLSLATGNGIQPKAGPEKVAILAILRLAWFECVLSDALCTAAAE
jgi:hypothetical protein